METPSLSKSFLFDVEKLWRIVKELSSTHSYTYSLSSCGSSVTFSVYDEDDDYKINYTYDDTQLVQGTVSLEKDYISELKDSRLKDIKGSYLELAPDNVTLSPSMVSVPTSLEPAPLYGDILLSFIKSLPNSFDVFYFKSYSHIENILFTYNQENTCYQEYKFITADNPIKGRYIFTCKHFKATAKLLVNAQNLYMHSSNTDGVNYSYLTFTLNKPFPIKVEIHQTIEDKKAAPLNFNYDMDSTEIINSSDWSYDDTWKIYFNNSSALAETSYNFLTATNKPWRFVLAGSPPNALNVPSVLSGYVIEGKKGESRKYFFRLATLLQQPKVF